MLRYAGRRQEGGKSEVIRLVRERTMADHDVLSQQRYAPTASHHHQSKLSSEQAHELNEALVGKRKRGTVGQDAPEGGENVRVLALGEPSLESGRSLKRRNGAEVGGGPSQGDKAGTEGEALGAQTRKRKSLEKLAASSSEQDVVSIPPDRNNKKRKAGGVEEEGNGLDPAEASDEGTVAQGPALRIRFTRRGNAFSVTKKGPVEGARNGEENDSGHAEFQDVHIPGEDYRHRGNSEIGLIKRSGMEGEPSSSDGPSDVGKVLRQSFAAAVTDATTKSLPAKCLESRQPLTREIYRIPSHSGWFSWMKIHNIERRTLIEFFDGKSISKTPKIYKDYRDFIINKYRENMRRTLTFTEVRRMLIGDVNALRRVFDFLDHWGLINHQVAQENNDQMLSGGLFPTETVVEPIPSGVRVALGPVVTPSAAAAPSSQADSFGGVGGGVPSLQPETLSSYKNVFIPVPKDGVSSTTGASEKSVERCTCISCGADCTKLRFCCQNEGQADYNLCAECFRNGKYKPGMVARDFIRMEAESEALGDQWTTKETLSLLEAITYFGDNWNQVADHVGSKSRGDCVERFIQLPFGDRFLSDAGAYEPGSEVDNDTIRNVMGVTDTPSVEKNASTGVYVGNAIETPVAAEQVSMDANGMSGISKSTAPAVMEDPSPFEDASNPLLAQVAFMSSMIGPRVAAAAAEAAIMAIADEEPAVANLHLMNGHTLQSSALKDSITTGRQNAESVKESSRLETRHQGALPQQGPHQAAVEKDIDGVPALAQVKASIGTALGAAAVNAKLLADQEEREMEHLMSDIIENQLKRLYAKVEHFEELEMLVEKERIQLEQARQLLYAHHIQFAESRFYLNRERHG